MSRGGISLLCWICPRLASGLAIAAGAMLATACNDGGSPGPEPPGSQHWTPFQREILSDGVVTAAEYERAVLATLQCLDERGVPHSVPELAGPETDPRWKYTIGPYGDDERAHAEAAYDECHRNYERAAIELWVLQNAPSEDELQEKRRAIVDCLRDRGVEFANYDDLLAGRGQLTADERELFTRCQLLHIRGVDEFGRNDSR